MEGTRNYTIRLYRVHDYDLIALMLMHDFDIRKGMYIALKNFCKNRRIVFETPAVKHSMPSEVNWIYRMSLFADAEDDEDIISILDKVQSGCRNSFMKNVLRLYLCNPMPDIFLAQNTDLDEVRAMLNRTFKHDCKIIEAEDMCLAKSDRKRILMQTEEDRQKKGEEKGDASHSAIAKMTRQTSLDEEILIQKNQRMSANASDGEHEEDVMGLFAEITGM